jgi:predicted RNase H-like HicB family nuclease
MNIAWSDEDQAYIVSLPEFPGQHTHGATYEEAFTQGLDLLETWIAIYQEDGKPLPQPQVFVSAVQQAS